MSRANIATNEAIPSENLEVLVEQCRKLREALSHAKGASEHSFGRIRDLRKLLEDAEVQHNAAEAEANALKAAGILTKPVTEPRRIVQLNKEIAEAEAAQQGGKAAITSIRSSLSQSSSALNEALQRQTSQLRQQALQQYRHALQDLRDAFAVIEEIDERPLLSIKTEIPDIEPGELAFRSTKPSEASEQAMAPFASAFSEYRQAVSALDPT